MAPSRKYIDNILARLNFPLYTVQMLTNRHVIVGGGGGSSKTGVANGFEIFELAHDGTKFLAEEITRHETGPSVVMNCAAFSDNKHSFLVAGQESHCQLYNVESVLVTEDDIIENISHNHELKQRKPKAKQKTDNNKNSKRLKFMIKPSDSVQTDFQGKEPLLRVTRFHPTGKILATGGTDGIVRLWKFPALQPAHVLKAHTKEIDDLDFSIFENYLISIAKDGQAVLWDCSKGRQIRKLTWKQPEGSKYLYKRARFGVIEGEERKSALYMLANPTGLAKKQKSYLQQWLPDEGVIKKSAEFDESLAALAVRNDGRFVAVGTMFSGSVMIYIAFSLQRVLHIPGAHSMFVTGLEFLPVSQNHTVASVAEAAVLSISVDNHVCIHTLPYRRTMPALVGILILVLTLFLTFVFCSYIGL
ncbi:prolactin regulatory element-binding protein [Tribolium castaneum]|uniref:Prolactin regulatory element-binding protein-like Protein n=1 Tax=Tribolium castaneum TaxID=7070 RepID=D6WP28_TRICA|nr:PREDICTED: prolactin regulatory element-binding protein isoform X1 [Tribolium castaneum]EFA04425.1 Prolactin regulatory element-binding protein-like Protein [Tribolium castaneum]|eukprot:XP_975011.1 PREDICTED: prolactin regulatory element-binding protein isoform X1 [Tribolium castaneum]